MKRTQSPNYEISEIDELFYKLYNYYPSKEGQSFELIVGAILKIINPANKIAYDERIKGEFDENTYQIDVSFYGIDLDSVMVEVKDHSKDKKKVSRPEIDKLAGSLLEVNFNTGYFFSTTDFTRDAKKKSLGSQLNPNAKSIFIYHLRPSKLEDNKNRIENILFEIKFIDFDYDNIKIFPKLGPDDISHLFPGLIDKLDLKSIIEFKYENNTIECNANIYNEHRDNIGWFSFIKKMPDNLESIIEKFGNRIIGEWEVENGQIEIRGKLQKTDKVLYDISFIIISVDQSIKPIGKPIILVKSDAIGIDKLITDNQMRGIVYSDKEVLFNGAKP